MENHPKRAQLCSVHGNGHDAYTQQTFARAQRDGDAHVTQYWSGPSCQFCGAVLHWYRIVTHDDGCGWFLDGVVTIYRISQHMCTYIRCSMDGRQRVVVRVISQRQRRFRVVCMLSDSSSNMSNMQIEWEICAVRTYICVDTFACLI